MTAPTESQWDQPTYTPPTPPPPRPKPFYKRAWFIVSVALASGGLLGLIVLGALLSAVGESIDDAANPTNATVKRAAAPAGTSAPTPTEPDATSYDTPAVADFKLTVKELSRQRFGSAGDNVEYRVQLVQVRDRSYDPDKEYELSYKITGGDSGNETQTMRIQGDEYEQYEGYASTRGGVKIKATPVGIEEV